MYIVGAIIMVFIQLNDSFRAFTLSTFGYELQHLTAIIILAIFTFIVYFIHKYYPEPTDAQHLK